MRVLFAAGALAAAAVAQTATALGPFTVQLRGDGETAAAAAFFPPAPGTCVEPAVCTAPAAKYSRVMNVQSRSQWGDGGGYCGSLSIQAIAMNYGAYISQDKVRKAAGPGGGHGDKAHGYEILHTNIGGALDNLKLAHEAWDYKLPLPQTAGYLAWLKGHLAAGSPVVWMIMCKGDGHDTYGLANYDHVEPVWGLYSNHSLDDPTVYPDDVLVHGADYGAKGSVEGPSLYRRFDGLADSKAMDGNCSDAVAGWGHNEFYPCVPSDGRDWGFAITGYADAGTGDVKVSLAVDRFDEPDIIEGARAAIIHGTVTAGPGLTAGANYTLYRWDDVANIPADGDYASSQFTAKHAFTASGDTYVFADPKGIVSSGTSFYRAQRDNAN